MSVHQSPSLEWEGGEDDPLLVYREMHTCILTYIYLFIKIRENMYDTQYTIHNNDDIIDLNLNPTRI